MTQLVQWEPFMRDLTLSKRFGRGLNPVSPSEQPLFGSWAPAIDIYDAGDEIMLLAELPGMSKDDIDIRIENNVFTLTGARKPDPEIEQGRAYRAERAYGTFTRSFTLPTVVDINEVKATYENGILRVRLPKAEQARPRQIQVGVS